MKRMIVAVVLLLGFVWALQKVMAASDIPVEPARFDVPAAPDVAGLGRVVPYFLLLVALAGGGIYLLKHGMPMRAGRAPASRKLQIPEMRSLGNRQFLVVVEYEDSRMLLGVTPGKIDYLCALESHATTPVDFVRLAPGDSLAEGPQ